MTRIDRKEIYKFFEKKIIFESKNYFKDRPLFRNFPM